MSRRSAATGKLSPLLVRLCLVALCATSGACSSGDGGDRSSTGAAAPPTQQASTTAVVVIEVRNMKFSPDTVTIKPGQTVQWRFDDKVTHSVEGISDMALEIRSPILLKGEWSHKFTAPGRYRYLCPLHPEMKGAVVVAA